MRRFTLFTLLYLATGVCLTAIALQYPALTPNIKTVLLIDAGLLYLCAVFTTFPFWHQSVQRSQARLHDKPAWYQNLIAIVPWFLIGSALMTTIFHVLNHDWTPEAIASVSLGLIITLLSVENLFAMNQISQ